MSLECRPGNTRLAAYLFLSVGVLRRFYAHPQPDGGGDVELGEEEREVLVEDAQVPGEEGQRGQLLQPAPLRRFGGQRLRRLAQVRRRLQTQLHGRQKQKVERAQRHVEHLRNEVSLETGGGDWNARNGLLVD